MNPYQELSSEDYQLIRNFAKTDTAKKLMENLQAIEAQFLLAAENQATTDLIAANTMAARGVHEAQGYLKSLLDNAADILDKKKAEAAAKKK